MGKHYSGTYTRLIVEHVQARFGDAGVTELLGRAGQPDRLASLSDDASWSSFDEFRRLLEAATDLLGAGGLWGMVDTAVLSAGSMPGMTEALVAMGSPSALLAELNEGTAGTTTVEDPFTSQVGPTTWDLGFRLHDGFEPFPELCQFHVVTATMLPRLFGCRDVAAEEITCQRRGDGYCTIRLSWEEDGSDSQRAEFLATKLDLVERRLQVFQDTVADVVTIDELDGLLERIVQRAAGAVRVPGFVLALDPLPWPARLVHTSGIDEAAGARHARGDVEGDLVVDIESSRRHHGRIIAVGGASIIPPGMQGLLRGYAQLAASALDSAVAVEEARRQAATARLLLELSTRLARAQSLQALADTMAEAVAGLIDCDRTVVALVDGLVATPIAVHGYDERLRELVLGTPLHLPGELSEQVLYLGLADVEPDIASYMRETGSVATVMVPIFVDGAPVAWISGDVVRDPHRLDPARQTDERLQGLAAQAGTALHNMLLLERVRHQADHDALTGLANRKVLVDALASPDRRATAVLFVDLDDFKDVNDGLGHHAGDVLLCDVALRLRAAVRDGDMVARLGGDEFAVVVSDPRPGAAQQVARRVVEAFADPFDLGGTRVSITASVGLATGAEPEELLRSADVAMYRAKAAGKGRLALFEPGMDHAAGERLTLHAELAEAIPAGELRLLFQPVLDLDDGSLRGGEALVRWQHPRLGMLTPDRFIGLAEDTGLINPLGSWVLREACAQAVTWPSEVAIAVNISPRQLDDGVVVQDVAVSGLAPSRLILEITESVLAQQPDAMIPRLEALRALGVRLAVDDFGTGYSSLGALVQLPVDILKIDRAFITRMLERPAAADLVQVLIDMGRTLNLEVVAEGIEDAAQALALREQRCRFGQGFLYSPPVPADEFVARFLEPVAAVDADDLAGHGAGVL